MDNIKDENLKRLGRYIAEALIEQSMNTLEEDWVEVNMRDQAIGELARCVTLQNLYLDREEYEKCAVMKLRIQDIKSILKIDDFNVDLNLEDEDEE